MKTLSYSIFSFVLLMVFPAALSAARQQPPVFSVNGTVTDDKKETLPYANVALLSPEGTLVAGGATDVQGKFSLKVPAGKYTFKASFMGFGTQERNISVQGNMELGGVPLQPTNQQLSDVVVTARLTERKGDRMVLNLLGSPLAVGKNTKEILQYAPGVWVDPRGTISINGNSSVRVMINDRDVRMSGQELLNYLETLKAEDILRIEVIPISGAEYEANSAGGVIRITLKKQALEGVNGSVGMQYSQSEDYPGFTPSANVNYKRNRWSLTGRYNFSDRTGSMTTREQTEFFNTDTRQQSSSFFKQPSKSHYGDFGVVYDINDRSEVGAEVEYYNSHGNNYSTNFTDMTSPSSGHTMVNGMVSQNDNNSNIYATAYYKIKTDTLGSNFKVIADLMSNQGSSYMESDALYYREPADEPYYRNLYSQRIPATTSVYTVRADFEKKTGRPFSYAAGAKYANSSIDSDSYFRVFENGQWRDDPQRSNRFRYHEEVWAAYGRTSFRLWGNNITAGLRLENTSVSTRSLTLDQNNSQSYFDFFPSLALQRSFGKDGKHSISANYSRRISRPYYGIFNPYMVPLSEFSAVVGNPDIKPSYVSRYSVTGVLFSKYSIDLSYTHIADAINQVVMQDPADPNKTLYKHVNTGTLDRLGLSVSAPIGVRDWWGMNLNGTAMYVWQDDGGKKSDRFSGYASMQNNFTLGKGWTIDLTGFYQSGGLSGNMQVKGFFSANASVVKKALDNRLVFSLGGYDIFGTMKMKINADDATYHRYVENWNDWRKVVLSVRWNFTAGKKDVKIKKVESGSQDERGRL